MQKTPFAHHNSLLCIIMKELFFLESRNLKRETLNSKKMKKKTFNIKERKIKRKSSTKVKQK